MKIPVYTYHNLSYKYYEIEWIYFKLFLFMDASKYFHNSALKDGQKW